VVYEIEVYPEAREQIRGLPADTLTALAEAMVVLELTPWNGEPYNKANPSGGMRQLVFGPQGEGMITYLILEDQRRVDLLRVFWAG
jgi:hypothetical protein